MTPKEFRALLRGKFIPFLEKSFHTLNPVTAYRPNWHIEAVAHVLEQCQLGVETRQIICMPPRYLKSHIISIAWPAYLLGHNPALKIFVVSYGTEFAEHLARNFRTVVEADWYRKLFPAMKLTKTAEALVQTSAGGERRAVSMIGAITGFGADIIIIDDPQKADEALSENARDAVHRAYTNTILSRLNDKQRGVVVLVAQRIHDDDLAGRLIASKNYACLQLPAIATEREQVQLGSGRVHVREIGDVLHPARDPQAILDQIKREMGSAAFQAEKGEWDLDQLKIEFEELIIADAPIEISGFSPDEVDQIIVVEEADAIENGPLCPDENAFAVARPGDIFGLGPHRLICGDATDPAVLRLLMHGDGPACLVLTDEPYNVPIAGHVTGGAHREFAMGSGEMTPEQFLAFNLAWIEAAADYLCNGGVFGTFIDWRGQPTVHAAATKLGLEPLNLIVWAKSNAGMGSLYRSQHELLPLFKKGAAPHVNNISLGKRGRWRSNVWSYPGASSLGSDARRGLQDHPTVKPTAMLEDAILDLTNRNDIVVDPFLGSGSSIIAAERTGRICRGVELDPLYVDVILRRYEATTGKSAVLAGSSETFERLAARRETEAAPG